MEELVWRREERLSWSVLSQSGRRREEVREILEGRRGEAGLCCGSQAGGGEEGAERVELLVISWMVGEEEVREGWEEERREKWIFL